MRLFLALDLPEGVRAALGGSERLHVTLLFLGERGSADGIWEPALEAAGRCPAPLLAPKGVVAVPRRSPRLFALDLADEGGRGAALHAAVSAALDVPVERPFWPHVTLVRVRRGRRPEKPRLPGGLKPFAPSALTLYESRGGRYAALESKALRGRV